MRRPIPHLPVAVGVPEVVAPGLFVFECVSALRRMVVRKDLEEERTRSAMGLLGTMPVSLRAPQGLVERAWAIATELDRPTAYDSFYLGVAELSGIECWTADRRLFNAAHEKKPWLHHLGEHRPSATIRACDAHRGTGCRGARSDLVVAPGTLSSRSRAVSSCFVSSRSGRGMAPQRARS